MKDIFIKYCQSSVVDMFPVTSFRVGQSTGRNVIRTHYGIEEGSPSMVCIASPGLAEWGDLLFKRPL